ncbi:hypothetical protein STCU_11784 [Strigomonas culicis]|uniref:Uncharacterized protein n=1 Tax=Strigomonas culicis TaxID=28005 RepID=S9TFM7_9TRYP|nr:hypothetical protein STCU_11784 [Strigomonas culicis]|eukprot:EPY15759.1 hypothetical protein STCU_11784 [Strigomonas culicis]
MPPPATPTAAWRRPAATVAWVAAGLPVDFLFQLWWVAYQGEQGAWGPPELEDLTVFYAIVRLLDGLSRLERESARCFLQLRERDRRHGGGGGPEAAAHFLRSSVAEVLLEQWQRATAAVRDPLPTGGASEPPPSSASVTTRWRSTPIFCAARPWRRCCEMASSRVLPNRRKTPVGRLGSRRHCARPDWS